MLGSWCKDAITSGNACSGSWTSLPEPLNPYDSLVSSITNASDIPDSDVFVWYYDWRKQITDLASQLNTYINSTALAGKPAGTKVKLVGHSYGGLVASKYAEDNSAKVGKLITVGSPHKGAVMAYGAWGRRRNLGFPGLAKNSDGAFINRPGRSIPNSKRCHQKTILSPPKKSYRLLII